MKVGVCCMDVKLFSRPMAAILNRLRRYDDLTVIPFGNRVIFDRPVEVWPIVDFLFCFYSAGFPLAKAEEYVKLRNPICFNDVLSQHILLDRRAVYELLKSNNIPVPTYEIFSPKLTPHSSPSSPSSSQSNLPSSPLTTTTTTTTNPTTITNNPLASSSDAHRDLRRMLLELKNEEPTAAEIQALNAQAELDTGEDTSRKSNYWGENDPIQENEDCITVNGRKFKKPFVEKPIWAEDHNIYIYYPKSSGGGSKRLFRKIGDRSSRFYPNVSTVRRGGSFIYEEFISTDGADIKVYTVGPDYAHAEARKAPTVDGRVKRTADGKEVRYHVILTQQEKEIARKITQVFGQNICGFDILRSDGITYVCDVNGWSFVKGSPKYYNDCAQILYEMINFHLHPLSAISRASLLLRDNDGMLESESFEYSRGKELRCLLAVIRHGDRTPKQKVKVIVSHPLILNFFQGKNLKSQVKLKSAKEMEEFSNAISQILQESGIDSPRTPPSQTNPEDSPTPLRPRLRIPLPTNSTTNSDSQSHSLLTGFSSSLPSLHQSVTPPSSTPSISISNTMVTKPLSVVISPTISSGSNQLDSKARKCLQEIQEVLRENVHFSGINRKVQIKPLEWKTDPLAGTTVCITSALLIFKYGGQLTDYGFKQADWLGKTYRQKMYPAERSGVLSLHSSFAHDIKFYASDEGRVQMTAAVFARAFLELDEEEIVPILYALVWNDKRANMLLEHSSSDSSAMHKTRIQLTKIMNSDVDFSSSNKKLDPTQSFEGVSVKDLRALGLDKLGNPRKLLTKLHKIVKQLCVDLETRAITPSPSPSQSPSLVLASSASPLAASVLSPWTALPRVTKLWKKLCKSFYDDETETFDISKVPEIADCALHDTLHHKEFKVNFRAVLDVVAPLANFVAPLEYGIEKENKHAIANEVIKPLVDKLISDLRQMRERKQLQTVSRFYFTSESHLNSLYNFLEWRLGFPPTSYGNSRRMEYIAQFVIKMIEDLAIPVNDPRRFIVEIWHSPGSNAANLPDLQQSSFNNFTLPLRPVRLGMTLDQFITSFSS